MRFAGTSCFQVSLFKVDCPLSTFDHMAYLYIRFFPFNKDKLTVLKMPSASAGPDSDSRFQSASRDVSSQTFELIKMEACFSALRTGEEKTHR